MRVVNTRGLWALFILVSTFTGYQIFQNYKNEDILKIGFVTDTHFDLKKDRRSQKIDLNWQSKEALEQFVKKINKKFHPDLVIEGGDFINGADDDSIKTWQIANKLFTRVKYPTYHVLGNHEVNTIDKKEWLKLTGYKKTYYYQDIDKRHKKFRVIVLDGNFFANGEPTKHGSYFKPGYVNEEQLVWLEKVLDNAMKEDREIVVFIHQPPLKMSTSLDDMFPAREELQNLLEKHNVRAVFSGHIERLCNFKRRNTRYITLQGFWKTNKELKREYRFKDSGSFYYITISPDDVDVVMEYRKFDDSIDGHHEDKFKGWYNLKVDDNYDCQGNRQLKRIK